MKTSKRIISLVLCAVMVVSTFLCLGPIVSFKAEAAITLGGITQQRVVSNYESLYAGYQARFFSNDKNNYIGAEGNWPTNFVIPGLSQSDYYTPQGMTYWEEKEWILISAYDASGSGNHSVIYALDAVTTEFVALFKILNANGSVNTSHGGGIAASEHNFYYADTGSNISYFPLSEMDVPKGTVKEIKLRGSINCSGELGGAATSYCCYEDGVLWAGNFYYDGDDRYKTPAHANSNSMLVGYRLHGNSSAEEWYYLSTNFNLLYLNQNNLTAQTSGAMTYTTVNVDGANAEIRGTITTDVAIGELTANYATATLTEGKKYKIEYISDNTDTDMYMFAPNGGSHTNVTSSSEHKRTALGDGRYHYELVFSAGRRPTGADSGWPTTQSTNGTYTGTYTIRFDQDRTPAGGREFNITDISITEYADPNGFEPESTYEGTGCAGNPTYVVMIQDIDKVQYAMVYKGKFYISRSWKRTSGTNHTRELLIGDVDINSPGTSNQTINGRLRPCHILNLSNSTRFGGDNGSSNLNQMFYMGEALCIIDDYLYMFGEGAAWAYNGNESDNKCPEPIDVIWKIDQHAIVNEKRTYDDTTAAYYEKVNSLSDIKLTDEYIIVHESPLKDPVTQKNILYAIDAFGGYGANKLPKQDEGNQANTGDSMGIVGYPITEYTSSTVDGKEVIYVPEEVDSTKSLHWQIQGANTASLRINNKDLYYSKNSHLYMGSRLFAMTTDSRSNLDKIKLEQYGTGDFRLYYDGDTAYYLWCNDGSNQSLIDTYTKYYANHGKSGYVPQYHGVYETPGTFHADADANKDASNSGNLTDKSVGIDMQILHIYKRVADPYSSAYDTRVFTDLDAELKQDGTYDIRMESYAISEMQYQTLQEDRPTDFIFVLDTSGSMSSEDVNGYHRHDAFDLEAACGTEDAAGKTNNSSNSGTTGTYTGNMWIQHTDGVLCQVSCKVQGDGRKYEFPSYTYYQRVYLWYTHPTTGVKYYFHPNSGDEYGTWTTSETTYDQAMRIGASSKGDRAGKVVFRGVCYEKRSNSSRMSNMQIAVNQLVWKIQEKATNKLDHRIAVVSYGSNSSGSWTNTGMYTTAGTSRVGYTGSGTVSAANYAKAFHSVSQFDNVKNIINSMSANGDTYVDAGMDMALNIIKNSGANYKAGGDRSVCVIMITDGCPGTGGNNSSEANIVANAAIAKSYDIKKEGGYVYSIQMGNNSMSGFDMDKYMDYISSEFISAQSMSNHGDRNVKDIAYRIDVPISGFNLDFLVDSVFESVTANSRNAIALLDSNAVIREQLTDAFIIPSDAKVTVEYEDAAYDGLGRLYFTNPTVTTEVTASVDRNKNTIIATGYNYTQKYVSEKTVTAGTAKKLVVTISGVLPNTDVSLVSTSINETNNTAIYNNSTVMNNGGEPIKKFPTEHFTIPEYTYYLDYGIPMYDSDINGTLCSVDSDIRKQSTYKPKLETGNMGIAFTNDNQDMLYTLNSKSGETQSKGYVLIKRDDGTYDWFRLNIVPASTVYYEENKMEAIENSDYTAWTEPADSAYAYKYQSISGSGDVFGSDTVYSESKDQFSLGTYKKVEVSASANRSETQKFTFTGTGFDLYSACGNNTGIQTVTVRNASTNELVKVYMVDTYYNDSTYNTLYQVPIVQFKTDNLATYKVEITAAYYSFAGGIKAQSADSLEIEGTDIEATSAVADIPSTDELFRQIGMDELIGQEVEVIWMDENSIFNGGTGAGNMDITLQGDIGTSTNEKKLVNYIDGFRTYNAKDYNDKYIIGEKNATYYSVIDTIKAGGMGGDSFAGYLEGGETGSVFGDYLTSGGPKYEVYLEPGNSLAFRFKANEFKNDYPRAMVSVRAASGSPKAKFSNSGNTKAYETEVLSRSETFFDITDNALGNGDDGSFILTITNTGDGLLAVDNIKLVNATLVPFSGISLTDLNSLISSQSVELEAGTFSVAAPESKYPNYTPDTPSVINPDPDLDIEGYIPDYEEYKEQKFEEDKQTFFEMVVDFFRNVIERIKEVLQALPVFWTKAK